MNTERVATITAGHISRQAAGEILIIQLTNNEFVIRTLDKNALTKNDDKVVARTKRRKYHNVEYTTQPSYEKTYMAHYAKIKAGGIIKSRDIVFEVVERNMDDYVPPKIAVPQKRGVYLHGKELKTWIKSMDNKYPKGWIAHPKELVSDDITRVLEEQDSPINLRELTSLTEVDDFE